MTGEYTIELTDNRLKYSITLDRKITIIEGQSGTGKTTFVDKISNSLKKGSKIKVRCEVPIQLTDSNTWQKIIEITHDEIIVIDESDFMETHEFAHLVLNSNCYFLLVYREPLPQIPYSSKSVIHLRTSNRYMNAIKTYSVEKDTPPLKSVNEINSIDAIVCEDSEKSTVAEILRKIYSHDVVTTGGNSNILPVVTKTLNDKKLLVIVDDAAFGPYIQKLLKAIRNMSKHNLSYLYQPESFEYILLDSKIFKLTNLDLDKIQNTKDYADTSKYNSWEQFYTDLLIEVSTREGNPYTKTNPSKFYTSQPVINKIRLYLQEHNTAINFQLNKEEGM